MNVTGIELDTTIAEQQRPPVVADVHLGIIT